MKVFAGLVPLLTFSLLILSFARASGSACCGGGFAAPAMITGDDKAQISVGWVLSRPRTEVSAANVWNDREDTENIQTLRLDAAHVFNDRWQAGVSVPVQSKDRSGIQGGRSAGLADISVNLGYEILPEWSYSPWKPRGFSYLQLVVPSGQSVYDTSSTLSSRGRGFWALGAGLVLTKAVSDWDLLSMLEVHRSLPRSSQSPGTDAIVPGTGGTLTLGAGFNLAKVRIGTSLAWSYEDPIAVTGINALDGAAERYATASLSASYLFEENLMLALAYSDQTLFGAPVNTTLSRSLSLLLQRRWQR